MPRLQAASHFTISLSLALAVLVARAAPVQTTRPSDLVGEWAGTFEVTPPDGKVVHDTVVLTVKQSGATFIGSIGQTEDKQSPVDDVKLIGSELRFMLGSGEALRLEFRLSLDGGHLKGTAVGKLQGGAVSVVIDASRVSSKNPAKVSPEAALFKEISHMDAVLFEAYDRADMATLRSLFTRDLEFYHDKSGLTNYRQSMDSFEKIFRGSGRMRRELVTGSMEVYPIAGYGAVETGVHRFYMTEPGKPERMTATAKFTHIWKRVGGGWKIARVVSYDHR